MLGMDGFEASQVPLGVNPGLPIVMLTVYQDMRSVSDIVEQRFPGYVVKGAASYGPDGRSRVTLSLCGRSLHSY